MSQRSQILAISLVTAAISASAARAAPICPAKEQLKSTTPQDLLVSNFTDYPKRSVLSDSTQAKEFYAKYFANAPVSPAAAQDDVAALFSADGCSRNVKAQLAGATPPAVYLYFTGYWNMASQYNDRSDEPAVLRWINERDPNALIIGMNWDCPNAVQYGQNWCKKHADSILMSAQSPELRAVSHASDVFNHPITTTYIAQAVGKAPEYYDYMQDLSYALVSAAHLIDQLQEAGVKEIYLAGYSMGAQAVADLLVTDFAAGGGFTWKTPNACRDGSNHCRVVDLKSVKWGLAMGLPGWSDALRHRVSAFDETTGKSRRSRALVAQYEKGGLYKMGGPYGDKLNVLERRYDPTGFADDYVERGSADALFADYNHVSHDYAMPWFANARFRRLVDDYVSREKAPPIPELGIIMDAAAFVEFDDCPNAAEACRVSTNYVAHARTITEKNGVTRVASREHVAGDGSNYVMYALNPVKLGEGAHPESSSNYAADLREGDAKPLIVRTMDQEDLRGSIEMYFKPDFDPSAKGEPVHGLFSYGSCGSSAKDLMPEAYIENRKLVFRMRYLDQPYSVELDLHGHPAFARGKWVHLAFSWNLPTKPIVPQIADLSEGETHRLQADANGKMTLRKLLQVLFSSIFHPSRLRNDLAFKRASDQTGQLVVAGSSALEKPLRTSFRVQKGQGRMEILVNGGHGEEQYRWRAEAPLGREGSQRPCLAIADALAQTPYETGQNADGSPFVHDYDPYVLPNSSPAGDRREDEIQLQLPKQILLSMGDASAASMKDGEVRTLTLGKLCKAYKIRNAQVFFGCAKDSSQSSKVSAAGWMDDLTLIVGPGRQSFDNVKPGAAGGTPKSWLE